jgi:predicted DNA-binding transcriptional regulator YafY
MKEFEVSRRTVARDLDFLRDEENAPLAYDEARHGYVLTDPPSPSATAGHARPTPCRR